MPKIKTNRMAKKKLFPNKKGTVVKRGQANKRHNTGKKAGKVKRRLSKSALVAKVDIKSVRRLLPYA
jgi:large subunit ribosomal protein L35